MNNKILKIGYVVLLAAIIVCVILVAVHDISMGLHSTTEKFFATLYALLVLYALRRIYQIVKDLLHK